MLIPFADVFPDAERSLSTVISGRCDSYEILSEYNGVFEDCEDAGRYDPYPPNPVVEESGKIDPAVIGGGVGIVAALILLTLFCVCFSKTKNTKNSSPHTHTHEKIAPTMAAIVPTMPPASTITTPAANPPAPIPLPGEPNKSLASGETQRLMFDSPTSTPSLVTVADSSSHNIDPSLLVSSNNVQFERDEKGDRKVIGRGAFGNVLVGSYFGTQCACKEILPTALNDENVERFLLELKLIGKLRHPNIVQCLGVVWSSDDRCILFELCGHGSLDSFIKKFPELHLLTWRKSREGRKFMKAAMQQQLMSGETTVNHRVLMSGQGLKSEWALQVARGCAFLHAQNPPIVHRDLKCANVLISNDLTAKITDFGESRAISGIDENTLMRVGTPYFMAPEIFSADAGGEQYNNMVDVYSYGIFLLEIFWNGEIKKAFKNMGPMIIMNRVGKGWRPDLKAVREADPGLAEIIEKCWDADPSKRPTFEDLVGALTVRAQEDESSLKQRSVSE